IFLFLIFCFWGMTGFEIAGIYRVKRKLCVTKIYPKSRQLFHRHSHESGNPGLSARKLIEKNGLRPLQNSPKSPKFPPRHLGDFS
ncbi:TPA: hypothetical protein ACJJP4_002076, partial [Neisseria meningitidis]